MAPRTATLVDGRRVRIAPTDPIDANISAIAEQQRGRVSRGQLRAVGVDRSATARRVRSGRLVVIHSAVYGIPGTEDLPLAAETAALLACGEGAVLSHHSAITLWGLRPGIARPVHITVPRDTAGPRLADVVVHRSCTLAASDRRVCEGLPVICPARALLDVAATLPDRDVERLLDEALFVRRLVKMPEIADVLARAGKHPGRARLARVVRGHTHSSKTDSPPEERMLVLIRAGGLPEPRLQVYVLGYRLDFYWPALGLALEVDAYGTHGSPARFEADRRRDARLLTEKGIIVLRVTEPTIRQRPYEALGLVARAIGQREAALRAA